MHLMNFVLNPGLQLRGWKNHPYVLLRSDTLKPAEYSKEQFDLLLRLDGVHSIDQEKLSQVQNDLLQELLANHQVHRAIAGEVISGQQRYKQYPAIYKNDAQWSITGRCNFRCRHCFMSAPEKKFAEPTLEECLSIVRQLKECGVHAVTLTGGEPLVSPWLWQIIEELKNCGIRLKGIYSNGALVNEALLDRLEEMDQKPAFMMSFDGIGWHDWIRGIPGAEEKVINAYRLCQARGFETTAAMCLHRHNLDKVNESIRLLDELGCGDLKISQAAPSGLWAKETEHFISMEEIYRFLYETVIPRYFEDKIQMGVNFAGLLRVMPDRSITIPAVMAGNIPDALDQLACGAVSNSLYISPEGRILPCMSFCGSEFEKQCPSLREHSLSEILTESSYCELCKVRFQDVIDHNEKCSSCHYKNLCGGGCRQAAVGEDGMDYLAASPTACEFFLNGWYEKALELCKQ